MRNPFHIFSIKKEERWLMLFVLLFISFLNSLVIIEYYDLFTPIKKFYWTHFIRNFHVSGFDPITYSVVSKWSAGYNVYRHPLLAFFMYVPYLINQGLIAITGQNCAIFVVAGMQTFWGFYSMLFFYRIMREVIELTRSMATLMTLFFMSFAYIMLSCMVPDHFIISMMLLLLAIYISGRRINSGREFKIWQSVLYFTLTAGVTLSNGIKIFLASLFVNRKHFFRPANILLGVLLPSALIWGFCRWEYAKFVWPYEVAQQKAKAERKEKKEKKAYEMKIAQAREDSILRAKGDTTAIIARNAAKAAEEHKKAEEKKKRGPKKGKPISNGEFMRWTDVTSSRIGAIVENLFGESIQLHQDYLLGDVLRSRPMIVNYRWWVSYVIEGLIVCLFALGIWIGRRSRFLWLVLSFFGMDLLLHVGLGFGLNEVYIMSAHWIYAIPIAIGFIVPKLTTSGRRLFAVLISLLTAYLLIYNVSLLVKYFL